MADPSETTRRAPSTGGIIIMKCKLFKGKFTKLYAPKKGLCEKCYHKTYRREYYIKNAERLKQYSIDWYNDNHKVALEARKEAREDRNFDGMRERILERDGYKCTVCNSEDKLVVHHKDFNGRGKENPNNDEDNLITLCKQCHVAVHRAQLLKARELTQWSRYYPACIECGTTKIRHSSNGRCNTCAARLRRGKKI